ncbi:MAG: UTP--glucose-1-phosphate uridylyltransferase, partial [Planctomycetes bacterium]|nr:UTP--glucose-1-phosphate uridylyltransferase [Planctomycetota bacterium]
KATAKTHPDEKVGVFCRVGNETRVVEYTELGDEQREACDDQGRLRFRAGNIAIHLISTDFLLRDDGFQIPYHLARKALAYVKDGVTVEATEPNSVRFESFLFDAIPFAKNPMIMEVRREEEFAPIKNLEGADSPETARTLLQDQWESWLREAGVTVPHGPDGIRNCRLEISPLFATSAEELRERVDPDLRIETDTVLE